MTSKERCLAALGGKTPDRVPVFPLLMFLAADRAGISYRQFATSASALADSQLLMRSRFPLDALTVCSDAFRLCADLGGEMVFPETKPPHLARPIATGEADLNRLGRPDPLRPGSRMADRCQAVSLLRQAAGGDCLIVGWVDMPFAEACNLFGITEFMMLTADNPALVHRTMEFLTGLVADFAVAQVAAGADMIGAGDAAASLISPGAYREFVLPYEQRVCQAVHDARATVKMHICGNTNALLSDIARSGADLFNVDHMVPLARAVEVYGAANKCFKGNLNPVADFLEATPDQCRRRALECIRQARGCRYMLGAGCEIPAAVSDEVFMAFCLAPQDEKLGIG